MVRSSETIEQVGW